MLIRQIKCLLISLRQALDEERMLCPPAGLAFLSQIWGVVHPAVVFMPVPIPLRTLASPQLGFVYHIDWPLDQSALHCY